MGKTNHVKLRLPNWWQVLIIVIVLITVIRMEPMEVLEAIKEVLKAWLEG